MLVRVKNLIGRRTKHATEMATLRYWCNAYPLECALAFSLVLIKISHANNLLHYMQIRAKTNSQFASSLSIKTAATWEILEVGADE